MPDYAASVQAVAVRMCKLDAAGAPLAGATNCYVTTSFTQFAWTPEYTEGEEITTVSASGEQCVYYKMPDTLKTVNVSVAICKPQPEVYEMLGGGSLLTETTENVGWAAPNIGEVANVNGVSIEVWSRAIVNGRPAAVNPYWRWVIPSITTKLDGDRTLENGALASEFTGVGVENANWGSGPGGDFTFPSTQAIQYARDTAYPAVEGYAVVPAV